VVYQQPLAYLLGLEGVALLRTFAGHHDRAFGEARIAEIRRLLDAPTLSGDGVTVTEVDTVAGYQAWSATYDRPGNGLFPYEVPFVHEILAALPAGVALDAACGTGRHSEHLAALGHRVIGVDSSPDMLARARARVPAASFHEGDLHALPVPDGHVDLVVCALALAHLPDLRPAVAEFARVLRPGGHLIITDVHQERVALGSVPHVRSALGSPGLIPSYRHRAADYLGAALTAGFELRRCEEPRPGAATARDGLPDHIDPGPWDAWPWSLADLTPAARDAAQNDTPVTVLWHFQRATVAG
jgi:SAM-dependent methyltransferase